MLTLTCIKEKANVKQKRSLLMRNRSPDVLTTNIDTYPTVIVMNTDNFTDNERLPLLSVFLYWPN